MAHPVNVKKYPIGATYNQRGIRWVGGIHKGIDYKCPTGTSVKSPVSGTVVGIGNVWGNAFGRHQVVIEFVAKNAVGIERKYWVVLAHMSSCSVKVGQKVAVGKFLGRSGSEGNVTGPHLHMEVQTNRYWLKNGYRNPSLAINFKGA